MAFFDASALRIIQEHETDYDAPVNEETESQIRENIEHLLMAMAYTGTSGTLSSNPPDSTVGTATDSGGGFSTDAHNGRSLVMMDGAAKGNIYPIADTTSTTVVCTGYNLYADGVRSGDSYKIFFDLSHSTAHTHDDVDSALADTSPTLAGNYVIAAESATPPISGTAGPTGYSYERAVAFRLSRAGALRVRVSNPTTGTIQRGIVARNGTAVGTHIESSSAIDETEDISGWSIGDLLELYVQDAGATGTWTIEVCCSNPMYDPAYLLESEL